MPAVPCTVHRSLQAQRLALGHRGHFNLPWGLPPARLRLALAEDRLVRLGPAGGSAVSCPRASAGLLERPWIAQVANAPNMATFERGRKAAPALASQPEGPTCQMGPDT